MNAKNVRVDSIRVRPGRESELKPDIVGALVESMREHGQLHAITLTPDHTLIAGLHRLSAAQQLGWSSIAAVVIDCSDEQAEIIEIDENLRRKTYTALELSQALTRRKQLYEALHPETKKGTAGSMGSNRANGRTKAANDTLSFAADTAQTAGVSRRSIERAVEVGEKLTDSAKTQIAGTKVENSQRQLKELADLPPDEQQEVATLIGTGKASSVSDAKKKAGLGKKKQKSDPTPVEYALTTLSALVRAIDAVGHDVAAQAQAHLQAIKLLLLSRQ